MRTPLVLLVALVLALVQHAVGPSPASACSFLGDSLTVRATPANGVLIIRSHCFSEGCFGGALPDALSVVDTFSGQTIAGEVVRAEGDLAHDAVIAWRPDQPLVPGRDYQVTWRPEHVANESSVQLRFPALPESTWTAADLAVVPDLSLGVNVLETVSCPAGGTDMCFGNPSRHQIALSESTYARLGLNVDASAVPEEVQDLYVLEAAFWRGDEERPAREEADWVTGLTSIEHAFARAAEEYCYEILITSLVDGSTATHEDCLPHGALGEVLTRDILPEELAAQLMGCTEAPEGYERQWCRSWTRGCAIHATNGTSPPTCATVGSACADVDLGEDDVVPEPPGPDAGAPVAGSDAGATDDPDVVDGEGEDEPDGDDEAMAATVSSCGCRLARQADDVRPLGLLALLGLALGHRARRRRISARA